MPEPEERGLARLRDGWLSYAVRGPRDAPALLLHRPLGGSMALWGPFATRLATQLRVIAFDPRGVGRSSDVPLGHSTRDMAEDAVALLDALGVTRPHVFGISLGGMVASWMAIDAPERVDRLVLASTLNDPGSVSARALRKALGLARCFLASGVDAEVCLVRRILSPQFREAHPERVREIERCVRSTPARRRNLVLLSLAAARHHTGHRLREIPHQTQLLFGGLDPLLGRRSRAELLRDCPHARLDIVPEAGHDLTLEQPHDVADRVIAFLLS